MVVWYPDILEVYVQSPSTRDENGHFVKTEGYWSVLGKCRIEKSSFGSLSVSNNANFNSHNYTIYAPKDSKLPSVGQKLKVSRYIDGKHIGTVECQCAESSKGLLHCRIWAI